MYTIVPFKTWHLDCVFEQGSTVAGPLVFSPADLEVLEAQDNWTILFDDEPIFCGGVVQSWPGRYAAWALIRHDAAPHMRFITRRTRELLHWRKGRIEVTVREDFENGHRWVKLLGFKVENPPGILKHYGPEGEAHVSYVMFVE